MELKWILAVGLEVTFWLLVVGFLVLRYRFGFESVTKWFAVGVVLDTAGIVALGIWDYARTGEVSSYTTLIVALLVYALIWGKKDLARLDAWMERRVGRDRPRPSTSA